MCGGKKLGKKCLVPENFLFPELYMGKKDTD
jgi:hypothetical protein